VDVMIAAHGAADMVGDMVADTAACTERERDDLRAVARYWAVPLTVWVVSCGARTGRRSGRPTIPVSRRDL
jgi:hypothetical protein